MIVRGPSFVVYVFNQAATDNGQRTTDQKKSMSNQADKLRELIQAAPAMRAEAVSHVPMIVVAGGKAGVGATTVAVNSASALADRGERVLLIDASEHGDLADVAGIGREFDYSLADVMSGKCGVAEAMVRGPAGMRVLAKRSRVRRGGLGIASAPADAATCGSRGAQQRLLTELESLRGEIDIVIVDAGHGLTAWTRRLCLRAQLMILVTTTDDAALLDTYAALKLSSADSICPTWSLVVNRFDSDAAAEHAHRRITNACQRFLSLRIEALPGLPRERTPRLWEAANSPFGHAVLWLGRAVSDALAETIPSACATACGEANHMETF